MSLRVKAVHADFVTRSALAAGAFLLLLSISTLLSCSKNKVVHATSHPTFTYSSEVEGVIGIAGVTSVVQDPELQEIHRCHLPALLAQSIKKIHPERGIAAPERLRQEVGEEKFDNMVNMYETTGELGTSTVIDAFTVSQGVPRYVILARVEQDYISNEDVEVSGDKVKQDYFTFQDVDEVSGTEYITRRTMSISFKVYDLETTRQVLATLITRNAIKSRFVEEISAPISNSKSFSDAIGTMIFSCLCGMVFDLFRKSEDGPYPPPPEVYEVADDIFEQFAEDLPEHV